MGKELERKDEHVLVLAAKNGHSNAVKMLLAAEALLDKKAKVSILTVDLAAHRSLF